ncbi:MAG: hypothetical protein H6668_21385 [Ardenticatenaceae bacterium]|nr:hypothetical protein [Ardenticatenaceae bacterium]
MARDKGHQSITIDQPGIYRIKIQGRLSQRLQDRFDEMAIAEETNLAGVPLTTLTGQIADQAALHGLVARIRDLGLPLILVELVSPVDPGG